MIRRGTTPTHIWTIPFDAEQIKDVRASYSQNDKEVIVKTFENVAVSDKEIKIELTQEETFSLEEGSVDMQLRILTADDKVVNTDIITKDVYKALNEEVLK
jgi:hypothetical protein